MKSLKDFLFEAAATSKTVTFNFKDLENAEETIKSLEGREGVTIDDQKLTLEITPDNVDKLGPVQDILQQYCQTIRNSSKRSSDEQYAQKTKSFEENIAKMNDAIDEIENPEEDESEENDDKKEE